VRDSHTLQQQASNKSQKKRQQESQHNNKGRTHRYYVTVRNAPPAVAVLLCFLFLLSVLKTITKINVISLSYTHEQKTLIAL